MADKVNERPGGKIASGGRKRGKGICVENGGRQQAENVALNLKIGMPAEAEEEGGVLPRQNIGKCTDRPNAGGRSRGAVRRGERM